jgi:hypothetical protein
MAIDESKGDLNYAYFAENHRFQIPEGCHWEDVRKKTIDNCGGPIVFSISPGGDRPETADFLKNNVNMWRTSDDFWDNWHALKNQFEILKSWAGMGVKGCYPDGDMLPLGKIGLRAELGEPRITGFTKDE